jgi:threonine/homoserine/homoserine lactone efflux protein
MISILKGIGVGASIAIPVGPIGIICLRRMLMQGPLVGIMSGLGASTADLVYSSCALIGLSFIYSFLVHHLILVRIVSSIFLCSFGLKIILSDLPRPSATWTHDMIHAYFSTLFLTLANPLLILSFIAGFAALGVTYQQENIYSLIGPVIGVFIGSSLWWFILGGITSLFKPLVLPETLHLLNKIAGYIIIIFGLFTLLTIFLK